MTGGTISTRCFSGAPRAACGNSTAWYSRPRRRDWQSWPTASATMAPAWREVHDANFSSTTGKPGMPYRRGFIPSATWAQQSLPCRDARSTFRAAVRHRCRRRVGRCCGRVGCPSSRGSRRAVRKARWYRPGDCHPHVPAHDRKHRNRIPAATAQFAHAAHSRWRSATTRRRRQWVAGSRGIGCAGGCRAALHPRRHMLCGRDLRRRPA